MQGIHFSCGGHDFFTFARPTAHVNIPYPELDECHPVTVFFLDPGQAIDSPWIEKEKSRMLNSDDVMNEKFLDHVLFCQNSRPGEDLPESVPLDDVKRDLTVKNSFQVSFPIPGTKDGLVESVSPKGPLSKDNRSTSSEDYSKWKPAIGGLLPPSGPYFLHGKALYKVYRLYEDPNLAFMFGVTEDGGDPPTFREYAGNLVPVPSRLYFEPPNEESPLRGRRVAVKDVYQLAGTPTSASCRDFQAFTGLAKQTSNMILKLVHAGAVVVGKTKTAQFASGEYARDWVDYPCPFNPRGDGYREPDCSSTGSAAAVAAYAWLDYSIGTDTLGSMIGPAADQGIFGNRPTHGISDLDGILPVSSHLDTAGFFARSITDFLVFGTTWYTNQRPVQPTRILYATEEFAKFPADVRLEMDSFVLDLERVMGLARVDLDVSALWNEKMNEREKAPLTEYLATTLAHIQLFDCYRNNLPFREAFKSAHGREPYANPMIRFKWDLGSRLTSHQYNVALKQQEVYRKFVREQVLKEDTILVLPCGRPKPRYRDVYDPPPGESGFTLQGFGFLRDIYSFLGGLPQLVIPIATVSRVSPVTSALVEEPVAVSLVGPKGSDCFLMGLAERVLRESGRPSEVRAGATLF